MTRWRVN